MFNNEVCSLVYIQDLTQHTQNSQRVLQEEMLVNTKLVEIADHHVQRISPLVKEACHLVKKLNESQKNETMLDLAQKKEIISKLN